MLSKFCRAEMALEAGADLVLELPLPWSMASAERFATGGVAILHALGCVNLLSFGSECGNINLLRRLASLPDMSEYRAALHRALSSGVSYAAARQAAVAELLGEDAARPLSDPNNTLGMEYIRAAETLGAKWEFFTLSRQGALHASDTPVDGFASGSLLRQRVFSGNSTAAAAYMPKETWALLETALKSGKAPACAQKLENGILARLRTMSPAEFSALPYLSEGLENRLYRASKCATSLQELLNMTKTRRYPLPRLRRILWSGMLGMTAEDASGLPPYIRVLGMNRRGREILATARPTLPLVSRTAQFTGLDARSQRVHQLECIATDLRALMLPTPLPCATDQMEKLRIKEM